MMITNLPAASKDSQMSIQQRNAKHFLDSSAASYQRNNNSSFQNYNSRETSTFLAAESPQVADADVSQQFGINDSNGNDQTAQTVELKKSTHSQEK
jgi:hypothetical protein